MNMMPARASTVAGTRLQVGALCRDPRTGQVLLVTSRGTGRWIIPKGWPMADRSHAAAALQEAWEEGGVLGRICPQETGRYRYDKWRENGPAIPVEVAVFLLEVDSLAEDYPEASQRRRKWVSPAKAAEMVDEKGLRVMLKGL